LLKGKEATILDRRINRGVLADWDLSQTNILVIDVDVGILEAMRLQLESWGSQVEAFSNHFDSIKLITEQQYQPDLIIIDYRLENGIKGTDVISEILTQFKTLIPVIFISAEISPETIQEIKSAGFQLLHKPVRPAALRMTLQRQLKLKANYV